jgi:hypothetical protein
MRREHNWKFSEKAGYDPVERQKYIFLYLSKKKNMTDNFRLPFVN